MTKLDFFPFFQCPKQCLVFLIMSIDGFLHWHNQVNSIAVKLNRANVLLLIKIRNYVNMKTLRNNYFALFVSHLCYSCIVWTQNINTVRRLTILQKKALQIMNFKDQLFHPSLLFSSKNSLKFDDKITFENILFVSKSINKQALTNLILSNVHSHTHVSHYFVH